MDGREHLCDRAVTGDGPGTGVWQWGPCSGVGEAGRPGGQRRSEMTAAAVGVGGLALWRSHPARRFPALCVHRAAAPPLYPWSASFMAIMSVHPWITQNERDGLAGCGECRTYPILSCGPNQGHQWMMHILGNCIRRLAFAPVSVAMWCMYAILVGTAITWNIRPLTLKPKLHLYDLLWTCCWCAILDLAYVQNGEHRRFGWRAARL